MSKQKLVIIDGHAIVHRAFHALPPLTNKKGVVVNAVYGFLLVFFKVLKDLNPTHVVVAFDLPGPTFRHKVYKEYKATRAPKAPELYAQFPILKEVLKTLGVATVEAEGYEADDIIGTLSAQAKRKKLANIIVTGDLDTLQLVDGDTQVLTMHKGITDTFIYDAAAVQDRYGLPPKSLLEYRGLKGDPSDNIPGVKGIGEKTASQLIKKFGTLEKLYSTIAKKNFKPTPPITERIKNILLEHKEEAYLSRQLSVIDCAAPISVPLDSLLRQAPQTDQAVKLFQELEFKSLLPRLNELDSAVTAKIQADSAAKKTDKNLTELVIGRSAIIAPADVTYTLVDNDETFTRFFKEANRQTSLVLDTETTSLNPFKAKLLGLSFCWQAGQAWYVDVQNQPAWLKDIGELLANVKIAKWAHNLKYDWEVLQSAGLSLGGWGGDTMLASYLLNSSSRAHDLDTLAFTEFGHRMIPITDLIGEKQPQKSMADVPLADVTVYSCEDADYTWRLKTKYEAELKSTGLIKLFESIEVPMIPVLADMERSGIKIDPEVLNISSKQVGQRLSNLETKIHTAAGQSFNVASPLQLKNILFEVLKIDTKGIGKTKTGLSTAAAQLEKLQDKHPIIPMIMEYRELAKLKSTYLDTLPELVSPQTGRIHTSFNQTIAATGRLSSTDPNLQNIPIRTELGNQVRQAFIAEPGNLLLSADYSQFELRIAASLANDKAMIEIFRQGHDIHRATAAKIHGLKEDEVTKAIRSTAKEVNFGVLYGMGPRGLAQRTGISQDEARAFIDKYFETFSGLKTYIEETKALSKKLGYAETMFGRRRYLPELNSGMPQVRAAAERMAVNMPIQGTQADIMKLAMIEVYKKLPSCDQDTKMLLQVHDELVFEVPAEKVKKVGAVVKEIMETVTKLKVPIEVHVSVGKNWGQMEAVALK